MEVSGQLHGLHHFKYEVKGQVDRRLEVHTAGPNTLMKEKNKKKETLAPAQNLTTIYCPTSPQPGNYTYSAMQVQFLA
jgi:hypothetical protein